MLLRFSSFLLFRCVRLHCFSFYFFFISDPFHTFLSYIICSSFPLRIHIHYALLKFPWTSRTNVNARRYICIWILALITTLTRSQPNITLSTHFRLYFWKMQNWSIWIDSFELIEIQGHAPFFAPFELTFNHHCLRNKVIHKHRFRLGSDRNGWSDASTTRTQQSLHKSIELHEILLCALLLFILSFVVWVLHQVLVFICIQLTSAYVMLLSMTMFFCMNNKNWLIWFCST